jgi:hypothetical protein
VPSSNNYWRWKETSITYPECVSVALVMQHAKLMRRIILSSVACPALPYFSTLSHKRHDFQKRKLLNIKCVLSFSKILCEILLILEIIQQYIIINVLRSSCKVPLLLSDFNHTLLSLTEFQKSHQIQNFRKICAVGTELFHADGWMDRQTDRRDGTTSRFLKFYKDA